MTRRRHILAVSAAAFLKPAVLLPQAPAERMGVATTSYMTARKFRDTLEFVEHCHRLDAAGVQTALTSLEPAYLERVNRRVKELGMYIEVMSPLPGADVTKFVQTMEAAKHVNALCVRSACLSGRRYENFGSMEDWKKFVGDSRASIARAVPVADRLKLPFAIENHKDWTVDEMVPLLQSYSSEYFGVCLDTGNNIALLDDPMEAVEKLAPFAVSTHIKDMATAEYENGFVLSEVVIGEGMLDVPKIVATIRKVRPATKLTLEMITRDPLKIPALTDKYWLTFPERSGSRLARTLKTARLQNAKKDKLPMVTGVSAADQIRLENDNVKKCLAAAL